MSKLVLIDNQDRTKLNEGRRHGLGYGFCKREDDTFTTVMPISACKDYLSDIVWSEATGKGGTWYNLICKPQGIFKDGKGYLAMTILRYFQGGTDPFKDYTKIDADRKLLVKNYKEMEACVNWFERKFGQTELTVVEPMATEGFFLAIIPKFWLESSVYISLFGTLLRHSMGGFEEKDPVGMLEKRMGDDANDMYVAANIIPKIKQMLAGYVPEVKMKYCANPHGLGLYGCAFPTA